ncbi:tRNA (adenine(58)-N(1))-methyltransferase non-catalytic subunit TRM6 [Condylostylus longicornis]|uniref:tRNA (adenine(58)-N(1))-methyltransferase non-catalytic subunit TRM6 n=1 Tax=Condylostylus longicornis TaxID=2530218 RepID=UPI00244DF1B2|nr:tRNA (adenine(58)-N(1))-methyltransferase non-catalytic subunit TRM6 [Condylostylus longicornis]
MKMDENPPQIKVGDYIIIQRQKYIKLHKFSSLESTAALANEQLELRNIEGKLYYSTFKMIVQDKKGGHGGKKRLNSLELCTENEMRNIREILNIQECGEDNRNITASGNAQNLKSDDIYKLKDECSGSAEILEKIVENSKSFASKTEYSQEKYLKKKEKKYFEFVQIRQPTIRLLAEIFYRLDPDKVMGIRMDTLSQIISYSGICGFGKFLLYESGTNGLLPAAFLNSMGVGTEAQLVHMHPGNICQKQGILAMNFPTELLDRCISVNIYSVLREYFQNASNSNSSDESNQISEPPFKKQKMEKENTENGVTKKSLDVLIEEKTEPQKVPQWHIANQNACELIKEKFDSLIIASKEHPSNILKTLLPFLKPSRPVVIFNLSKEILAELYVELKTHSKVTDLHLTSTWLRYLQILPNRTHPEVNMNANSGYLLHGYTVNTDS